MVGLVHAFEIFEQVEGAVRAGKGIRAFAAIPSVASAFETGRGLIGVIGTDRVVASLVRFGLKLALKARRGDEDSAAEMVDRMKAEVPERTGRLLNGITFEIDEDGTAQVRASAVNPSGRAGGEGADYARFVEFGTEHMAAEPFFLEVARAVLEERGRSLDEAVSAAAGEEGF